MDFSEILIRVQREFGDDSEVQITAEDVLRWANDAQLEVARKTECIQRTAPAVPSVIGQETYGLQADFLKVLDVWYDGLRLDRIDTRALDVIASDRKSASVQNSTPQYYRVRNRQVLLWPYPDAAGKDIVAEYVARPTIIGGTQTTIEVPEQYHPMIVTYCLGRAYSLDGAFQPAQSKQNEFETKAAQAMSDAKDPYADTYPLIGSPVDDWGY